MTQKEINDRIQWHLNAKEIAPVIAAVDGIWNSIVKCSYVCFECNPQTAKAVAKATGRTVRRTGQHSWRVNAAEGACGARVVTRYNPHAFQRADFWEP